MAALLYSGGATLGAALILLGGYLLVSRVRGNKTEIELAGFGKLKTTNPGITVVFLGAFLFATSMFALNQRDRLVRNLEDLTRSQDLIVSFLSPSLLADSAFLNYFKSAPPAQQKAILEHADSMLRPKFREITDKKRTAFTEADFTEVASIYQFLYSLDSNQGSALYYRGEVQRLLRNRHPMRENFNLYLHNAPPPGIAASTPRFPGYFDERTGWINHLLANDFLCEAFSTEEQVKRSDLLDRARDKAKEIRKYWSTGFDATETMRSTKEVERIASGQSQFKRHSGCIN